MSVNRSPEVIDMVTQWVAAFEEWMSRGARSVRLQWDVEDHAEPLTLYANRSGTFIVEPGEKPVPVKEWLA